MMGKTSKELVDLGMRRSARTFPMNRIFCFLNAYIRFLFRMSPLRKKKCKLAKHPFVNLDRFLAGVVSPFTHCISVLSFFNALI